ncbi:MAG: flagellar hook-basal body complex protein [Magnetococcales bacterium]|nr:flagellar hook-basal body complex protein [Magnetococcales bacterium]
MSIMQAMLSGSSALTSYGEAMTVIGNNLANSNTTAFKGSRTTFEDVLIQTVGVSGTRSSTQIGTGVGLSAVDQNMSQGSFNSTNSVLDLSIDGKGYFQLRDENANLATSLLPASSTNDDAFYTRAGDFKKTKEGTLVANNGMILQGWKLKVDGTAESSSVTDVDLSSFETSPPKASTKVTVGVNLSADTPVITDSLHSTYDPNDSSSYNHSTTVRVYDSLGKGHNVDLHFKKLDYEPATITAGTNNSVTFDLSDAATVTFTFTPSAGGTPVIASATGTLAAGSNTVDTSTLTFNNGTLTNGTQYDVSYAPSTGTVMNVVGQNNVAEVPKNSWDWHAVAATEELVKEHQGTGNLTAVDTTTGNVQPIKTGGVLAGYTAGRLEFDEEGKLLREGATPITFNFHDYNTGTTAKAQDILFDFGSAIGTNGDSTNDWSIDSTGTATQYDIGASAVTADSANNTGIDGTVQYAGEFATLGLAQDGYTIGYMDSLSVNQDGKVFGTYTNGQTRPLYQVALVDFDNEAALTQIGSNLFGKTNLSGEPRIGTPQSGRLGNIMNFSLEQSNVDMSSEFVQMISTQRAFQANSRIVTVTDGMLEELIALKR